MDGFVRAIEKRKIDEASRIWNAHVLTFGEEYVKKTIKFKTKNVPSLNEQVVKRALRTNIEVLDYVLSLDFEVHPSYLKFLFRRRSSDYADDILEYLLINKKISDIANTDGTSNILHRCLTYKQVFLLSKFKNERLDADVLISYIKYQKYKLFNDIYQHSKEDGGLRIDYFEQNQDGDTILHYLDSSVSNFKEHILNAKDLTTRNNKGVSAFRALYSNLYTYSEFFLDCKIKGSLIFDINDKNEYGDTILHHKCSYSFLNATNIIKKMIDLDGDIYALNNNFKTPISYLEPETAKEIEEYYLNHSIPEIKAAL